MKEHDFDLDDPAYQLLDIGKMIFRRVKTALGKRKTTNDVGIHQSNNDVKFANDQEDNNHVTFRNNIQEGFRTGAFQVK